VSTHHLRVRRTAVQAAALVGPGASLSGPDTTLPASVGPAVRTRDAVNTALQGTGAPAHGWLLIHAELQAQPSHTNFTRTLSVRCGFSR